MMKRRDAVSSRGSVWCAGACVAATLAACSPPSARAPVQSRAPAVATAVSLEPSSAGRTRLFVLPELVPQAAPLRTSLAGDRQWVLRGMRLLEHADGSLERAEELLPAIRNVRVLELPSRLGGGFVFSAESSGATLLWRSPTWLGPLAPLARVDFDVERLVAGFDRLYLFDRRGSDPLGLDPASGRAVDLGALPPAPSYGSMAFANAWFGAVDTPVRGVLASFDAGASWHALGAEVASSVSLEAGEIVLATPTGPYALDESGALRQRSRPGTEADALFDAVRRSGAGATSRADKNPQPSSRAAVSPLGVRPLREAILRGVPEAPGAALVAVNGALARVRLSDGKVLALNERGYAGSLPCQGVAFGSGLGFVCGDEQGGTTIHRVVAPLSLEPARRFSGPRLIVPSGNGALVVQGPCGDRAAPAGTYCVLHKDGRARELRLSASGVERIVVLDDGRIAVLVPPRFDLPGALTLIAGNGAVQRRPLSLPKAGPSSLGLLRKGLWLQGFVEGKPGQLWGWIAGSGPFAGVRVDLDGHVELAHLEHDVDRALFAGRFALLFGSSGVVGQTTDNGTTWREIELPSDLPGEDSFHGPDGSRREQGCSELGCAFGPWLRVGWAKPREGAMLESARTPEAVARPALGGARWNMSCSADGDVSAPAASEAPVPPEDEEYGRLDPADAGAHRKLRSRAGDWAGLYQLAPPERRVTDLGFEAGTEHKPVQVHGYVWGPRGASWDRAGKWQLAVADPFSVRGMFRTSPGPSAWADSAVAAQAFGADPSGSSNWEASLEPSGRAGALVIASRGSVELFLFEEERGITKVRDAARFGFFTVSSVVKLGATWFLGVESGARDFRVLKVEGERASLFGEYALQKVGRGAVRASVVRSTNGDSLGIWARSAAWYVFPLDLQRGQAEAPLVVAKDELARAPRACNVDEDGWVLTTDPSDTGRDLLQPNLDGIDGDLHNVQARLIAGPLGACIAGLSARADTVRRSTGRKAALAGRQTSTTTLVVTEQRPGGRRFGYRCTR